MKGLSITHHELKAIIRGTLKQIRRPIKPQPDWGVYELGFTQSLDIHEPHSNSPIIPNKFKPDTEYYAIEPWWTPDMGKTDARFSILTKHLHLERLADVSERDMIREGFGLDHDCYNWDARARYNQREFFGFDLDNLYKNTWSHNNPDVGYKGSLWTIVVEVVITERRFEW